MREDKKNKNSNAVDTLMSIKGNAVYKPHNPKRDRFMPFCAKTSVCESLNANTIIISDSPIAIASQYPFPHQVEDQVRLLLENRTPALVILASSSDIQNHQLPVYFSGSASYGELQTQSKFVDYIELSENTEVKVFRLTIIYGDDSAEIPVLHVHNWLDHQAVSPDTTSKLIQLIESTVNKSTATRTSETETDSQIAGKNLPVIHCKAGVGRTGQTIAAMAMKKHPDLSLETIVRDIRASRNDHMIQTNKQMRTLIKISLNTSAVKELPVTKPTFSWRKVFGMK